MAIDKLDTILWKEFPTVMVPVYGFLDECMLHRSRLLMAKDGLYVESRQVFGSFIGRIWESPRELPYGEVREQDEFASMLEQSRSIIKKSMLPEAARYAEQDCEWAGWIVMDRDRKIRYQPLEFKATRVSVKVSAECQRAVLKDAVVVVDVHSHGSLVTGFSDVDDFDDRGGVRICMVMGDYRRNHPFTYKVRYAVNGFIFDVPWEG